VRIPGKNGRQSISLLGPPSNGAWNRKTIQTDLFRSGKSLASVPKETVVSQQLQLKSTTVLNVIEAILLPPESTMQFRKNLDSYQGRAENEFHEPKNPIMDNSPGRQMSI